MTESQEYNSENVFIGDITIAFRQPEMSDWDCYMFGNRPGGSGLIYTPKKRNGAQSFRKIYDENFL